MPISLRIGPATDVDPTGIPPTFPDELIEVHVVHQPAIPDLSHQDGGQANICRLSP